MLYTTDAPRDTQTQWSLHWHTMSLDAPRDTQTQWSLHWDTMSLDGEFIITDWPFFSMSTNWRQHTEDWVHDTTQTVCCVGYAQFTALTAHIISVCKCYKVWNFTHLQIPLRDNVNVMSSKQICKFSPTHNFSTMYDRPGTKILHKRYKRTEIKKTYSFDIWLNVQKTLE